MSAETTAQRVEHAAERTARGIDALAPSEVIEAAPEGRKDEARELAGELEGAFSGMEDVVADIMEISKAGQEADS